jgi:hypothetical protein
MLSCRIVVDFSKTPPGQVLSGRLKAATGTTGQSGAPSSTI